MFWVSQGSPLLNSAQALLDWPVCVHLGLACPAFRVPFQIQHFVSLDPSCTGLSLILADFCPSSFWLWSLIFPTLLVFSESGFPNVITPDAQPQSEATPIVMLKVDGLPLSLRVATSLALALVG